MNITMVYHVCVHQLCSECGMCGGCGVVGCGGVVWWGVEFLVGSVWEWCLGCGECWVVEFGCGV